MIGGDLPRRESPLVSAVFLGEPVIPSRSLVGRGERPLASSYGPACTTESRLSLWGSLARGTAGARDSAQFSRPRVSLDTHLVDCCTRKECPHGKKHEPGFAACGARAYPERSRQRSGRRGPGAARSGRGLPVPVATSVQFDMASLAGKANRKPCRWLGRRVA
jgi:hypothetical protein